MQFDRARDALLTGCVLLKQSKQMAAGLRTRRSGQTLALPCSDALLGRGLAQMERAQDHLDEPGRALKRQRARSRQADITNEPGTLMSLFQGAAPPGSR